MQVLQLLLASTEAEEEVRGVLAECLGHLTLVDPGAALPALQAAAAGDSPAARAAVVTAVKHAVVEAPNAVDAPLQAALPGFLAGIEDPDRCAPTIPLAIAPSTNGEIVSCRGICHPDIVRCMLRFGMQSCVLAQS